MPLLLTRFDLRPLAADDDGLDGAIDAVEASLLRSHAGDSGETIFAGLVLQRQFVMLVSSVVVAGAGSLLAGSSLCRPVQDVVEGVADGAGDAVE